ncbi:hypothetical protein H6F67_00865 [Microcoleus sp. FACHB-1515]|uniref:hypothetical protein n=1 Tax=Cyanophyceae TaxID=3028117 RepID=UPI00168624D1|nr:hypothetical protein [Microcoleus sp. FACHB-1515]MBD2088424.1 hypothetical protein [Microcoleus sp. FACHB-1515]
MPSSVTPCCVVVLNQEQEKVHQYFKALDSIESGCPKIQRCTVIENGQVVVKTLPAS